MYLFLVFSLLVFVIVWNAHVKFMLNVKLFSNGIVCLFVWVETVVSNYAWFKMYTENVDSWIKKKN